MNTRYALHVDVPMPLPAAREAVTALLQQEGFGVLTEIDVQATLHKKLGVEVEPHVILGACNPGFAHKAIQAEPAIGVLLPCNVVLKQVAENTTSVFITRVAGMFSLVDNAGMDTVAQEVGARLERVAEELTRIAEA